MKELEESEGLDTCPNLLSSTVVSEAVLTFDVIDPI